MTEEGIYILDYSSAGLGVYLTPMTLFSNNKLSKRTCSVVMVVAVCVCVRERERERE